VEGRVERRISEWGLRKRRNKECISALLDVGHYQALHSEKKIRSKTAGSNYSVTSDPHYGQR
jgi:hypothetical protein